MAPKPVVKRRGRPSAEGQEQSTRDRIIGSARQVFSELGYDAATYQAIALRAGLTRPAVNHYFHQKSELYRAVVEQTNALVMRAGMQRAEAESTLMGQLEAFLNAVLSDSEDQSAAAFLAISFLDFQRHPELRSQHDGVGELREFLAGAVARAIVRGELPGDTAVDDVADTLLAMLWGIGFYAGYLGTQSQLQAMVAQVRRLLAAAIDSHGR